MPTPYRNKSTTSSLILALMRGAPTTNAPGTGTHACAPLPAQLLCYEGGGRRPPLLAWHGHIGRAPARAVRQPPLRRVYPRARRPCHSGLEARATSTPPRPPRRSPDTPPFRLSAVFFGRMKLIFDDDGPPGTAGRRNPSSGLLRRPPSPLGRRRYGLLRPGAAGLRAPTRGAPTAPGATTWGAPRKR